MEVFEIVNHNGNIVERIRADRERQALCIYLMNHEELTDMMLWRNPFFEWRLAEYDNEDEYFKARKAKRY